MAHYALIYKDREKAYEELKRVYGELLEDKKRADKNSNVTSKKYKKESEQQFHRINKLKEKIESLEYNLWNSRKNNLLLKIYSAVLTSALIFILISV